MGAMLNFFYLMLVHPNVQANAHEELDKIIGRNRLPDVSDMDSLPYIKGIAKEVIRWFPNAPLAAPHVAIEEDEYKGMRIPKGSLIITNIW